MRRLALLNCILFLLTCLHVEAQEKNPVPGFFEVRMNEPFQSIQYYLLLAEDKEHHYTIHTVLSDNKILISKAHGGVRLIFIQPLI